MFKYHHLLPDEVGRQKPVVLFYMLESLNDDEVDYDNMPESLKMFYGK